MNTNAQKGVAMPVIITVIAVVLVLGGVMYYARTANEADTIAELPGKVRDAVRCHFEEGKAPKVVRLHHVREEVIAV